MPADAHDKHLYICGGTGSGKSKLLESLIRQNIAAWHQIKCGLLLLDPHGSLYDSLLRWLAWHPQLHSRPVTTTKVVFTNISQSGGAKFDPSPP